MYTLVNDEKHRGVPKLISRLECFFKAEKDIEKIELVNQLRIEFDMIKHENSNFLAKLKEQRDSFWAHSDKKYFDNPQKLSEEFPISVNELVNFSASIIKIIKKINSQILNKSLNMEDYWRDDVIRMIDGVNNAFTYNVILSDLHIMLSKLSLSED